MGRRKLVYNLQFIAVKIQIVKSNIDSDSVR